MPVDHFSVLVLPASQFEQEPHGEPEVGLDARLFLRIDL
jgi:hypothetical protein